MQKAIALKYPQGFDAPIIVSKSYGKQAEIPAINAAQAKNIFFIFPPKTVLAQRVFTK